MIPCPSPGLTLQSVDYDEPEPVSFRTQEEGAGTYAMFITALQAEYPYAILQKGNQIYRPNIKSAQSH